MQNCRRGSKSEVQIPFLYFAFCGSLLLASILFVKSPFLLRPILTYPYLSTVLRASTQQVTRHRYRYPLCCNGKVPRQRMAYRGSVVWSPFEVLAGQYSSIGLMKGPTQRNCIQGTVPLESKLPKSVLFRGYHYCGA